MGRRRGDTEMHREVESHGEAEQEVPHPCVVGKNQEGYLRVRNPSPRPNHPAQGSRARKISP